MEKEDFLESEVKKPQINIQDKQENLKRLLEFQKKKFLLPSSEQIYKIKTENLQNLTIERAILLSQANIAKDFVSFHVVENMQEVDSILQNIPLQQNCRRVAFIDIDETLFFSGALGWLPDCLKESSFLSTFEAENEKVLQLLKTYGFSTKSEFKDWGNSQFPYIDSWAFYARLSLLDSSVSEIFKQWHEKSTDIFCLTSRKHYQEVEEAKSRTFQKAHESLLQNFQEENINFKNLSKVSISNYSKNYEDTYSHFDSGIIYTGNLGKFSIYGGGIEFLEKYIQSFADNTLPQTIEIIVADNDKGIFKEIISSCNRERVNKVRNKYNIEIKFIYFQPIEERWLAPQHWDIWNKVGKLGNYAQPSTIAFEALKSFLETFCPQTLPQGEKLDFREAK